MFPLREKPMDAITKHVLETLATQNPGKAIQLSHQFLDGAQGKAAGFVPNIWGGTTVHINGRWWVNAPQYTASQ